tara:strand:+ start:8328 stop:9263 length:936 start_codon:yes stop_codon:yes gene_type:complete
LRKTDFPALRRANLQTLQVNVGYRCNQSCLHCHVNAGPNRSEQMSRSTADCVLEHLRYGNINTLDITGGAPELNSQFRHLVASARHMGVNIIDRCNLTILNEPGQRDLARFLADHEVEIAASLPCYLQENVDRQRGEGVYGGSLAGLQKLNAMGYGSEKSGLILNLVYNPAGPTLPPPQDELEVHYRERLGELGIVFNRLFTLANMPIARFGSTLISKGGFEKYMRLLKRAHLDTNLDNVMCRTLLSVDWQGYLFDCDFNQMLGLALPADDRAAPHLQDLPALDLTHNPIAIADHCYGCTAGQGSSCGGAL